MRWQEHKTWSSGLLVLWCLMRGQGEGWKARELRISTDRRLLHCPSSRWLSCTHALNGERLAEAVCRGGGGGEGCTLPCCTRPTPGRCGLYDDPARPRVCERYDGRACAYKARYGRPDPGDFVRLDRSRLARLSATLQVDADFRVVNLPDFDALVGIVTAPEQP